MQTKKQTDLTRLDVFKNKDRLSFADATLSSCAVSNYRMSCPFEKKPLDWYVVRTMWFNKQRLGIPLGSPDKVLRDWIKAHPGCCAARPTEMDPFKRTLVGSDIEVQIGYREQSPQNPAKPYGTIEWVLEPCGHFVERSGSGELQEIPKKFSYSGADVSGWEISE